MDCVEDKTLNYRKASAAIVHSWDVERRYIDHQNIEFTYVAVADGRGASPARFKMLPRGQQMEFPTVPVSYSTFFDTPVVLVESLSAYLQLEIAEGSEIRAVQLLEDPNRKNCIIVLVFLKWEPEMQGWFYTPSEIHEKIEDGKVSAETAEVFDQICKAVDRTFLFD